MKTDLKRKYKNKKIAVLGFGMEGKDAVSFFLKIGCAVTVYDRKEKKDLDLSGLDVNKLKVIAGPEYLKGGLNSYDLIVRSPGVYRFIPSLIEAEKNGVKVSSVVNIFFDLCPAKIIGVTGTKGKGTTSSLIYEILKHDNNDVYLSGNIGKPSLELLDILKNESYVVMELSSFQLIDLDKGPYISVVLNITSDHLDWHKDQKEYINAKKNIVLSQKSSDYAVINSEYKSSRDFSKNIKSKVVLFSKRTLETKFKTGILLRGEHNLENIAAAVAVLKILKINDETILETLKTFRGLEHRLELVGFIKGRYFYNDSFATNPLSTVAAVKSFDERVTLILGGSDKGLNYDGLGRFLAKRKNVKTVILIGQISGIIKKSLERNHYFGRIINLGMTSMKNIVDIALKNTSKKGVVLLSPASASFGMFKDYKDRGNQFKREVMILG